MSTIETLEKELESDLILDQTKLQLETANNPLKYAKWANKHANIRRDLLKLDAQRKTISKQKLDYYTGRGKDVFMDRYERSEMKTVMSADEELLKIDTKIAYLQIMLEYVSNGMDAIKSRGFAIKHIIDLRQFEAGK